MQVRVWRFTPWSWISVVVILATIAVSLYDHGIQSMLKYWFTSEEYSHGVLIPFISLFLIWQKKDILERIPFTGSWLGLATALFGIGLLWLGKLSAITLLMQYGFILILAGLALSVTGVRAFKEIWVALFLLLFMIPLPGFLFQELSQQLQLISTKLGVLVIRLLDISVHVEGNVIDLGSFKLQVVEACSGLRYLFPLMTLGFIAAYFYKAVFWKRAVLFLSTIPITILMNSFRIGAIGVLVEYWGQSMAEGFLHDFEGWVVFMACTGILILEVLVLSRIGPDRRPLREVFGVELPAPTPGDAEIVPRKPSSAYLVAAPVVLVAVIGTALVPDMVEKEMPRRELAEFPVDLGEWQGKTDRLAHIYLTELRLDDYLMADFVDSRQDSVNLYIGFHQSQGKGISSHSPRTCIPGGGWKITGIGPHVVDGARVGDVPLTVNRTLIQMGDFRQLVYYWFQQRGRNLTNEYLVKWFIFWDALTRQRTDGALVRLTTAIRPGETDDDADRRLAAFAARIGPMLDDYIPN